MTQSTEFLVGASKQVRINIQLVRKISNKGSSPVLLECFSSFGGQSKAWSKVNKSLL